ncbi:MAG: FAD-dependent monooxygenase [Pseudomonadota bacterium]|nr:FAD-dependent monooxygenase [Pseudomonadota bacterium]
MPDATHPVYDIAIVGAGAAGLALAAALKREARLKLALIAPAAPATPDRLRTVALSPGSRALIERVGAWEALQPQAQPIVEMAIFDGTPRDAVRLEQLRFHAPEDAPLAHMAYNDDVAAALAQAAEAAGVVRIDGAVADFAAGPFVAQLKLADGRGLRARLVVGADGARSKLRALAEIATSGWPTGQCGIVATIAHEREHGGRAEQHFLPAGPFAMLPLRGRCSSIVWNEPPREAERLCALPQDEFIAELERRFSPALGKLRRLGAARAFPLEFRFARDYVAERLALVGDAAHLVHPLAGQGLNLGLRDVAALAEVLVERLRLGLDPGAREPLAEYQRRRRFDAVTSGLGMDAMNRLFSNDSAALRALRDLGLRVVDRAGPLKRALIAEAGGDVATAPRLLRGLGL